MEGIRYGRRRRNIKRDVQKKVEDWLDSIDDIDVQTLARKNTIVTGGSIASMLLGEKVNDYDIYFRDKETTLAVAKYYVQKFNDARKIKTGENVESITPYVDTPKIKNCKGEEEDRVCIYIKSAGVAGENDNNQDYEYFELVEDEGAAGQFLDGECGHGDDESDNRPKYRPVFMSQNAITLSHKIQLVIRFYGEPDEIHNNYDYVHATCYWDHGKDLLHLNPKAMECLLARQLVYRGSLYPVASVFRMKKFLERGWRITAGEQLKMMWQIAELDLSDIEVIREQLTGVDMMYLHEIISKLKSEDPERSIDSTYVGELIDRIFNE